MSPYRYWSTCESGLCYVRVIDFCGLCEKNFIRFGKIFVALKRAIYAHPFVDIYDWSATWNLGGGEIKEN